ncbi:MAG: 50S ribosomal protein L3 [Candidatus Omnitrophota bacterium]|jgi:large subunit ribosomal protein L3
MIREIFGKKIGMTQVWSKDGSLLGVTLVEVEPVCILEEITYPTKKVAKVGCFKWPQNRLSHVKKPLLGYFKKLGVDPYKFIREVAFDGSAFPVEVVSAPAAEKPVEGAEAVSAENKDSKEPEKPQTPKREVGVELFSEGEIVTIHGTTKGRGFAGGIKRHGWHGGPSGHGSMTHRRIGSNGANTDPGRVVRGHRMPGHMGDVYRVVKNLKVVKIDKEKNLLFIQGSVPGARGSVVAIAKV